jgi:hypothetical protein
MMNDWYQRMVGTLQLNGKGERTQQAYTRSVRMLSQFYLAPIHTANLTFAFLGANHASQPLPLLY